jgi:diaminopimelate epimerase
MRIYNADGGEVSSCGNATRCVAWLLMEETGKKDITLATKAGIIAAKRIGKNLIAADMGKPGLEWKQIPLKYEMRHAGIADRAARQQSAVGGEHGQSAHGVRRWRMWMRCM